MIDNEMMQIDRISCVVILEGYILITDPKLLKTEIKATQCLTWHNY